MTKARDLANFVSAGNPLADGTIDVADINGLTVTADELNYVDGVTSAIQTQLDAKAATADIGTTIQPYDATILVDADIGVNVQAYDATILKSADINVSVQAYDADTAKLDVAQTFTANQTVTAEFKATSYNETYLALSGTTPAVDCEAGNVFALTTSGNTTFTFSNPPASGTAYGFTLKLTAGGTHTLTWPASVDWPGATAPDAPASGETNMLVFITYDGGTTWYGFQAGAALA